METDSSEYLKELSKYIEVIGRLINDNLFSKSLGDEETKESDTERCNFISTYNECCQTYSHNKFETLIVNWYFKKIFEIFMNNKEEGFLHSIEAINNNINCYENALRQIELVVGRKINMKNAKD